MSTLEERIKKIMEGNNQEVVPASAEPETKDEEETVQPEVAPEQEEPPVSNENPLSVDPVTPPEEQVSDEEKESDDSKEDEKKEKVEEMAMDTLTHPVHGKLSWENNGGLHEIKKNGKSVFQGNHEQVAARWNLIKQSLQESTEQINEALRLVSKHGDEKFSAKVYKDPEWEEHRVKFFIGGTHQPNADYHTDDLADAKSTAEAELTRMRAAKMESVEELIADDANLSEEFKTKAQQMFNESVDAKVAEITAKLEEKFEAEKEQYIMKLSEQINLYLEDASDKWVVENREILEQEAKANLTENFFSDVKGLFERYGIELPTQEKSIVESYEEELAEAKAKLFELEKEKIINESVQGLTSLDQVKLKRLIEELDASDIETFGKKVNSFKEALQFKQVSESKLSIKNEKVISESVESIEETDPRMAAYLKALSKGRI